ncbi:hypothetical protein NIES2135_63930 (plasmid) [Leptolyngbya boryana NIES-2135]|jgi:hypothetical protein|uniref:Uncharacterized protein n=1 Tax=Leptolyngbya boryana NIES-2135 TaxID=1973484 RepID=A0A1Z4JS52_LEPBY|nr:MULTISPECIES: hypothetical protein [Leptolyngbya]BAY59516.1 hypothetical protein NIES2135_63930 [Leptolyngbya boryana NIES-2135]MBD2371586.1 hypothetical protein [Leptolyngbya sp. FACHB-161]MBD2378133.1 hypothetical protein [Leptolyngbya sp. FACHB-238]MBD2402538.1 hypothetical protein [Leptolyngbya sp. FACHB-239]MBD2409057.1 hypothetical protein [Leptolyngbya sp. FACHB-402]
MSPDLSPLQQLAVRLLRCLVLSQADQLSIEDVISERAQQRDCSRALAAQMLHKIAWNF